MATPRTPPDSVSPPTGRHQEILDAAARIFHEKGYEATTTKDIGDSVGLLKGSLYYYIKSKEDLLYEVLLRMHTDSMNMLEDAKSASGDVDERLRAFIEAFTRYQVDQRFESAVLEREFRHLNAERRAAIAAERDKFDDHLVGIIREGQRSGRFTNEIEAVFIAKGLLLMMTSLYKWFDPEGKLGTDALVATYTRFALHGLTGHE